MAKGKKGFQKGECGNPGGRAKKESTILFDEYMTARRQLEFWGLMWKKCHEGDTKIMCKMADKLTPNKQIVKIITDNIETLFGQLGINPNEPK